MIAIHRTLPCNRIGCSWQPPGVRCCPGAVVVVVVVAAAAAALAVTVVCAAFFVAGACAAAAAVPAAVAAVAVGNPACVYGEAAGPGRKMAVHDGVR